MIILFSPGKGKFTTVDYIEKMLDALPEDVKVESATPSTHHLFYITGKLTHFSKEDEEKFHHFVAQLLYISKRDKPSIQINVYS